MIMADNNIFYQGFMSALQAKIPQRADLANAITDMLAIDKDAVYRRLRGEVSFSFAEMAVIARNTGISLDSIAGIENVQSKPTTMNISKQVNPTETDYEMFEGHVNLLKSIRNEPDTKIIEGGNTFPHYLYQNYENIMRFYMFRWNRGSSYGDARPFHKIIIPERLRALQKATCEYAKHISSTVYIWDHLLFHRFVTSVSYYAKLHLISDEDVSLIKSDLVAFVNDIEKLAVRGKHEETGKEVRIFITDINFDLNYSCLESKNIHLSLFWVFSLNAIVSLDDEVFNETRTWMNSVQRFSTLISVTGEKFRTAFLDEQRKIIDTL